MTQSLTVRLDELEHDPISIAGREDRLQHTADLEASIPEQGQLQSLKVRPWTGKPKGSVKWGVTAGGRRLAALRKLLAANASVQGVVVTGAFRVHVIAGEEDDQQAFQGTVAENMQRLPETPSGEMRAFRKLVEDGATIAAVAATFATTEKRVSQRLKLAALHDDVLVALDAGKISIEAAQAFTIEPDPARQAAYLKKARNSWDLDPRQVKNAFTEKLVRGDSDTAKLVGKKAYLAAGGKIMGDEFDEAASYWISPKIIDHLVEVHWAKQRDKWLEEGWAFVEPAESFGENNWGQLKALTFGYVKEVSAPLNAKQQAAHDKISAQIADLEKEHPWLVNDEFEQPEDEEAGDNIYQRLLAFKDKLNEIERNQPQAYTAAQKAVAGVLYFENTRRKPLIGVLKPGTKDPEAKKAAGDASSPGKSVSLDDPGPTTDAKLNGWMTTALRVRLQKEPELALRLLVCSLHSQMMSRYGQQGAMHITTDVRLGDAMGFDELTLGNAIAAMAGRDVESLLEVLATQIAVAVTLGQYQDLAAHRAIIDLVDPVIGAHFAIDDYFAGITKPLMQLAWRDMVSALDAEPSLGDGKKAELAAKVAAKAKATGWLPPQMRTPSYTGPSYTARKAAHMPEPSNDDAAQLVAAE